MLLRMALWAGVSGLAGAAVAAAAAAGQAPAAAFAGIRSVVAGPDFIHVEWQPWSGPAGPCRYRVLLDAESGSARSALPAAEVEAGATGATLRGLAAGQTRRVAVVAVHPDGREEPGPAEWFATPNPVRYVDPAAAPGGDGRSPAAPFRTVMEAVADAIAMNGVNVYLARGRYRERIVLFEGMMLYGGFGPGFSLEREAAEGGSVLASAEPGPLVMIAPGSSWCGLDGLELVGGDVGQRGVVADDCRALLTRCRLHGFLGQAVHLSGDDDAFSKVRARIQRCLVHDNRGEGVALRGVGDVMLSQCGVLRNRQEGIEADPLSIATGKTSRVRIEHCLIAANGDQGVNLDLHSIPDADPEGGVVEILVWDCVVTGNAGAGISIDVEYRESLDVELTLSVAGCLVADNGRIGVEIDADAPGAIRVAGNQVIRSGGTVGVSVTGDCAAGLVEVLDCEIADHEDAGIRVSCGGAVLVSGTRIWGGAGAPVWRERGWLSLEDCFFGPSEKPGQWDLRSADDPDPGLGPVAQEAAERLRRLNELLEAVEFGEGEAILRAAGPWRGAEPPQPPVDLVRLEPRPGSVVQQAVFRIRRRGIQRAPDPCRLIAGSREIPLVSRLDGPDLVLAPEVDLPAGTVFFLELSVGGRVRRFPYALGLPLPAPGEVAAVPLLGRDRLAAGAAPREYRVRVPASGRFTLEARLLEGAGPVTLTSLRGDPDPDPVLALSPERTEGVVGPLSAAPGSEVVIRVVAATDSTFQLTAREAPAR